MSTSPYFTHNKSKAEQSLFEDLCIETIRQSGVDVFYLPANREDMDPILGESVRTSFGIAIPIEAYMPDGGQTQGEGSIMSKFGFAQRDQMDIVMSKKRFVNQTKRFGLDMIRPREGDLIFVGDLDAPYASQVNSIFEISFVSYVQNEWSFGTTFVYKLSLQSYVHSHEKFTTGTSQDDAVVSEELTDIEQGINNAVAATKATLLQFDKKNPLSNI